jgi:hypothetical protein
MKREKKIATRIPAPKAPTAQLPDIRPAMLVRPVESDGPARHEAYVRARMFAENAYFRALRADDARTFDSAH